MKLDRKKHEATLNRIRKICSKLPEFREVEAWEHPTFRAGKKMFAACGVSEEDVPELGLKVGFERQEELLKDRRFHPTPYAAHQGWVTLSLRGKVNWKEVESLLVEAYRTVALKRMLTALDENK